MNIILWSQVLKPARAEAPEKTQSGRRSAQAAARASQEGADLGQGGRESEQASHQSIDLLSTEDKNQER